MAPKRKTVNDYLKDISEIEDKIAANEDRQISNEDIQNMAQDAEEKLKAYEDARYKYRLTVAKLGADCGWEEAEKRTGVSKIAISLWHKKLCPDYEGNTILRRKLYLRKNSMSVRAAEERGELKKEDTTDKTKLRAVL